MLECTKRSSGWRHDHREAHSASKSLRTCQRYFHCIISRRNLDLLQAKLSVGAEQRDVRTECGDRSGQRDLPGPVHIVTLPRSNPSSLQPPSIPTQFTLPMDPTQFPHQKTLEHVLLSSPCDETTAWRDNASGAPLEERQQDVSGPTG